MSITICDVLFRKIKDRATNPELSICTVFFRGTKERGKSGRFDRFECVNNTQTFERETLWVMTSRAAWHLFNSIVP